MFHIYLLEYVVLNKLMNSNYDNNFLHMDNFDWYIRIQTGEKPYKCSHCDKAFLNWSSYKTHKNTHWRETMLMQTLWQGFSDYLGLLNTWECKWDRQNLRTAIVTTFFSKNVICTKHINTHSNEAYLENAGLTKHVRAYTLKKPFQCKHCVNTFWNKISLEIHLRTHTG